MENTDLDTFAAEVGRELLGLRRRLPDWFPPGPYADDRWPLDPLERREAQRLQHLSHAERGAWRERTRERVERERKNPWREQDRWGLRKRVWLERRTSERALLERRERVLLERADELTGHAAQVAGWLRELRQLEPEALARCDELMRHIEDDNVTIAELNEIWQLRRRALECRAGELLAQAVVRAALGPALAARDLDALAVAIVATFMAHEMAERYAVPRIPALFATIAIKIDRMRRAGRWAEETI
jgi:hypothetical protein